MQYGKKKKNERSTHFSNYLMAHKDTTRNSRTRSPLGFRWWAIVQGGRAATLPVSPNPTGFDVQTWLGSSQWALWSWGYVERSLSWAPREVIPCQLWYFRQGEDWALRVSPRTMRSLWAATTGCKFCQDWGSRQAAEPWFSSWGCLWKSLGLG